MIIITDSAFFRYHAWLRQIWWLEEAPKRTSLCPVFQLTLWLTVSTILLSPIIVMGWLIFKLELLTRWFFDQFLCWKDVSEFIDWLPIGQASLLCVEHSKKNPAAMFVWMFLASGFTLTVFGLLALSIVCVSIFGFQGVIGFIYHIPLIPHYCTVAIFWVGTSGFEVMSFIGVIIDRLGTLSHSGLLRAANFLAWFFTNTPFWVNYPFHKGRGL